MRYARLIVIILAIATPQPLAQTIAPCATGARPGFDVVSIKPASSPDPSWMRRTPDGLTITGPLRRAIQYAFNLHDFQLSGGPDWFNTTSWEILAKSDTPDPDFARLNDAQRQAFYDRQMQELQSMLVDRFHLKCHLTTREMSVYNLVLSKDGSKLKESAADADKRGNISVQSHGVQSHAAGTGISMARLAILLAGPTGRMVIDKTGLTASYDFTFDWANDAAVSGSDTPPDSAMGPTIYSAVEEQLGLKLVPAKDQVPVLVIDQVDLPSQN